jgi:TolA-binding protein
MDQQSKGDKSNGSKVNCQFLRFDNTQLYTPTPLATQNNTISSTDVNLPSSMPTNSKLPPTSSANMLQNGAVRTPRSPVFNAATEAATQFKSSGGNVKTKREPAVMDASSPRHAGSFQQQQQLQQFQQQQAQLQQIQQQQYQQQLHLQQQRDQQLFQQQQQARGHTSSVSYHASSNVPIGSESQRNQRETKTFSAVIKPPPVQPHETSSGNSTQPSTRDHHVPGKNEQQRLQLQHLNKPAYQSIQKMLTSSASAFSDASLISRIIRTDEVCFLFLISFAFCFAIAFIVLMIIFYLYLT